MKKKVAIFTKRPSGFNETFIENHINLIGHEITVIHGDPIPFSSGSDTLGLLKRLRFRWKKFIQNKDSTLIARELVLESNLIKNKTDVAFAEYLTTGVAVLETCKKLHIPLIVTTLGFDISDRQLVEKFKDKYKELLNYCNYVLIVSKHMKEQLLDLGCPEHKIIYSPAGPAEEFFEIQPTFSDNNLFALGRFVEKKSPHSTIFAFQKVLEAIPDAKLFFCGDGILLTVAKDIVKALGLENSVFFPGRIDQKQQKNYLADCSVFIQHSKTAQSGDSEGTPVAILEAAAAGVPIVSTKHAGIPDVVINKQTGFLVNEGDIMTMAEKIIILLRDKQTAKKMGQTGKMFVRNNFSLEHHIKIINDLIGSV